MSILSRNATINKLKQSFTGFLTETSPFDQLTEHTGKVKETVMALVEEIYEYSQGNKTQGGEVSKLEFEADKIKQKLRQELPKGDLLMPVARSDLLSLLWNQDEIADTSQNTSELLPMLELKSQLSEQYKISLNTLAEALELAVEEYGADDDLPSKFSPLFTGLINLSSIEVGLTQQSFSHIWSLISNSPNLLRLRSNSTFKIRRS